MTQPHPAPALAGALSALGAYAICLAFVAVPVLGAHAFDTRTDAGVVDAVIVAIAFVVLAHGGAISLTGEGIEGTVSLTPLGLTLLCVLVGVSRATALVTSLNPVGRDHSLQPGAFRCIAQAGISFVLTYALVAGFFAMFAASASVTALALPAVVSSTMVALAGFGLGASRALRRAAGGAGLRDDPSMRVLPVWARSVGRALAASTLTLVSGAALVLCVQMVVRHESITAVWAQLDPGAFGSFTLVLGQLALLPTLIVWVAFMLLGGKVALGVGTGVCLSGAVTGVMPALPVLGTVPEPGDFPLALQLLWVIPVAAVSLGTWILARGVAQVPARERVLAWVSYPVTLCALVMIGAGLSAGSIGSGQLEQVGPVIVSGIPSLVTLVAGVVIVGAVWTHTSVGGRIVHAVGLLRSRVEALMARTPSRETEQPNNDPDTASSGAAEPPVTAPSVYNDASSHEARTGEPADTPEDTGPDSPSR